MSPREVSIDELAERIAKLEASVERLGEKLDGLPFVRTELYQAKHEALRAEVVLEFARQKIELLKEIAEVDQRTEVDDLDKRITLWSRTAVGSLLLPVVVAVVIALILATGGQP